MPDNPEDNEEQASEASDAAAETPVAEGPEQTEDSLKSTDVSSGDEAAEAPPVVAAAAAAPPARPAPPVAPRPAGPADPLPTAIAKTRKRPPFWAAIALAALPVWGILYLNSVTKPVNKNDPLTLGASLYASNCQSCHGASGGGGAGPALAGGAVVKTWPNYKDHIDWVEKGTAGFQAEGKTTYGAENKPLSGGVMPGFKSALSVDQITLIVYYERVTFGNENNPDLLAAATTAAAGGGK